MQLKLEHMMLSITDEISIVGFTQIAVNESDHAYTERYN